MEYNHPHRMSGVRSLWLRLKIAMTALPRQANYPLGDFNGWSDHLRQDVGLCQRPSYMDWKSIQDRMRL